MTSSCSQGEQALVTSIQYGFRTGSTMDVAIANTLMQLSLRITMNNNFENLKGIPDELNSPTLIDSIKRNALENPSQCF